MQKDDNNPSEIENLPNTQDELTLAEDSWSQLTKDKRLNLFNSMSRTDAEELFLNLGSADQFELIKDLSNLEIRSWLRLLAPDDAADLIQEVDLDAREDFLALLDPQTKREVTVLLAYAEDRAGGLMNSRFIRPMKARPSFWRRFPHG